MITSRFQGIRTWKRFFFFYDKFCNFKNEKTLNFILLFISFQFYFSQFYIVNVDKDGYVNVRDSDKYKFKSHCKIKEWKLYILMKILRKKRKLINVDFRFTKNNFENGLFTKID